MAEAESRMRLVAGLGNPGARYAKTRHNLGFLVVDAYLARLGIETSRHRFHALAAEAAVGPHKVLFLKPQTYMNDSGLSVREAARFYRVEPDQCLVVVDCLALPLGRLRIRRGGSDGGHKGLRSVTQHLGTQEFARLRIGIGQAAGETVDYVLSSFKRDEWPVVEQAVDDACRAVDTWLDRGVEASMNEVNG